MTESAEKSGGSTIDVSEGSGNMRTKTDEAVYGGGDEQSE